MLDNSDNVDIEAVFRHGIAVDNAIAQAAWKAVVRHKMLRQPIVVWRDGAPVWLSGDEISWEAPPGSQLDI